MGHSERRHVQTWREFSEMKYIDPETLAFLEQVGKTLAEQPDLMLGIAEVMDWVNERLHTEESSIFVLDKSTSELVLTYAAGPVGQEIVGLRIAVGRGVVGWVVKYAEDLIVPSTSMDPRFFSGVDEKTGFVTRSILCVPIVQEDEAVGAIEAINKATGHFNDDDVTLLQGVADVLVNYVDQLWENTESASS